MSAQSGVGLPEALERAASALPHQADAIRPANGDPTQLIELLEPAAASQVLRWLLVEEPADGAELIEEWLDVPERGAAAVLGVEDTDLPKAARKALRRAHHQLRSRGVALPEAPPAATVAKLPSIEEFPDEAILSPLDPRGGRAAYLVTSPPQGGVRMFEVLFDDARGIIECRVYNTGRSKVRKFLKEFERQGALAALHVAPEAARALIERAAAAHPSDRPFPRAFQEWRSQVGRAAPGTQTPGEAVRAELGASVDATQQGRAAELLKQGDFGPWPPEPEALTSLADVLDAIATSDSVVEPAARHEQMREAIAAAVTDIFGEAYANATATRLEETAYVLWQREHADDARACLAAADGFRSGSISDSETARALIEATLSPIFQKAEAPPEAETTAPDASE